MTDVVTDWPRDRVLGLLTLGRRHGLTEAEILAGTGVTLERLSGPGHGVGFAQEHTAVRNLLAVLDGVQHDRARELLAAQLPLGEVSRRLGYSEEAAFSRAFRRWSGTTPAAFRATLG